MARTILSCLGLGLATAAAAGTVAGLTGYSSPELIAAGTVVGGVAGNLATDLCKGLHRPAAARWLEGRSGIDENHHVASALRLAQLASLHAILTNFDEARRSDWDDVRRNDADRFGAAAETIPRQ